VHLSSQPRLGELAEKLVLDKVEKCAQDIHGLRVITFHSTRVTGSVDASSNVEAIREVDNMVFAEYNGLKFTFMFETKCNQVISTSTQTRKKAITQLEKLKSILSVKLGIALDEVNCHIMWPNMAPTESFKGAMIATFTKLRANPEPPGYHIFKDTFDGDKFSDWFKNQVSNSAIAISDVKYEALLAHFTVLSVGALHDREMGNFCVLAAPQAALVNTPLHSLRRPFGIKGLAGTGKTVSVCARIQRLDQTGCLTATAMAAFVFFNHHVRDLVENKLTACGVQMSFLHFIDWNMNDNNIQKVFDSSTVLDGLALRGIRHLYIDGGEDMGLDTLNKALRQIARPTGPDEPGDFWLLYDPYQGVYDRHSMERRFGHLYWVGNQLDSSVVEEGIANGRILTLSTSFRMTKNVLEHLRESHVVPPTDIPQAQSILGVEVQRKTVELPNHGNPMEVLARDIVAKVLYELTQGRGIHAGYCAILYDEEAKHVLFPPSQGGRIGFLQILNDELKSRLLAGNARFAPQVTTRMDESVQFQHQALALAGQHTPRDLLANTPATAVNSVQYQCDTHQQDLLKCDCKAFLGSTVEMKGNEVRSVVYLHAVNKSQGDVSRRQITQSRITHILKAVKTPTIYCKKLWNITWTKSRLFFLAMSILAIGFALGWSVSSLQTMISSSYSNSRTTSASKPKTTTTITTTLATTTLSSRTTTSTPTPTSASTVTSTTSLLEVPKMLANIPLSDSYYESITFLATPLLLLVFLILVPLLKNALHRHQVLKTQPYYLAASRSSCEVLNSYNI
jgi:hypothetical protein